MATGSSRCSSAARSAVRPRRSDRTADRAAERSEEHTSELQSPCNLVCRLLLEKKKNIHIKSMSTPTLPPSPALARQMTPFTTSITIPGLHAAYSHYPHDHYRDSVMRRHRHLTD